MDWLKSLMENQLKAAFSISSAISMIIFMGSVASYISDGVLTDTEIHNLMSGGSALQIAIGAIVVAIYKLKNNK